LGVDSYTPKSENYPNLGALCAFAGDTSSEFFSRQDAKLAKALRLTIFSAAELREASAAHFFSVKSSGSQRKISYFSELDDLCAFARDTSSEFFSRQDAKLAKALRLTIFSSWPLR